MFCTGPAKLFVQGPGGTPGVEYDFQVNVHNGGERLEMIHTNPGLIVDFIALPAETSACRNATIAGKFSYTTLGWGMLPNQPEDQTLAGYVTGAMSGGMQFYPHLLPPSEFTDAPERSALVDAWDTLSISGIPVTRHMSGWYKLDADCTGTIALRDDIGDPEFRIEMFIGRGGQAIYAVNLNTFDRGDGKQIPMFLMPIPMQRTGDESQSLHAAPGGGN
jgi:hypothetical protein